MAASLEPKPDEINLLKSADQCEQLLNRLKKHASDQKKIYKSGKKHTLLENVTSHATSNIQSLKTWTAAISKGRQTSDPEIRRSANDLFNNVTLRVGDAEKALDHRLALGRLTREKTKCEITHDRLFPFHEADKDSEVHTPGVFGRRSMRSEPRLVIFTI